MIRTPEQIFAVFGLSSPPMNMKKTECSETSAYKIQTPGNHPKERLQHSKQGESLKSRNIILIIKSRRIRWAGNVARMGEKEMPTVFLMGKLQGNTPVGRSRHWWKLNIKINIKEI
jgi:hypothetical protein